MIRANDAPLRRARAIRARGVSSNRRRLASPVRPSLSARLCSEALWRSQRHAGAAQIALELFARRGSGRTSAPPPQASSSDREHRQHARLQRPRGASRPGSRPWPGAGHEQRKALQVAVAVQALDAVDCATQHGRAGRPALPRHLAQRPAARCPCRPGSRGTGGGRSACRRRARAGWCPRGRRRSGRRSGRRSPGPASPARRRRSCRRDGRCGATAGSPSRRVERLRTGMPTWVPRSGCGWW